MYTWIASVTRQNQLDSTFKFLVFPCSSLCLFFFLLCCFFAFLNLIYEDAGYYSLKIWWEWFIFWIDYQEEAYFLDNRMEVSFYRRCTTWPRVGTNIEHTWTYPFVWHVLWCLYVLSSALKYTLFVFSTLENVTHSYVINVCRPGPPGLPMTQLRPMHQALP